ncbi:hypothetical protein GUITHDRAFT_153676 [Guillardia theta CCMP2712]|uniref:Uncharacterized protein n=1 Tax=Guillardia theta (strain CCMP2712) TaxID=905079 RepID=L1J0P7_GUITC|nr:hypothetical protein GUITHDRAFT_153676 [Guillardia theta CCMP2712]EKX41867.1 hypothetical protein GUITHDRAFT_153676 [Guillardia theta CCMP2712]|eukprot:XP_005828847.1 hypothetical protein GUITHDRAFT_153676 [Guillardia theta CCMP2712]
MDTLDGRFQVNSVGGGLTRAKSKADSLVIGIPEQQQPDPSDSSEHVDRLSPTSLLALHYNLSRSPRRSKPEYLENLVIPDDKKPDPSDDPEHIDCHSPTTLLEN